MHKKDTLLENKILEKILEERPFKDVIINASDNIQ